MPQWLISSWFSNQRHITISKVLSLNLVVDGQDIFWNQTIEKETTEDNEKYQQKVLKI
ncbi:hypothetical protein NFD60_12815 (plasmid) [Staphylococcus epidermidis]|nr:hypothetical protein NFD60_12815 [Staphylococcus epidermidis]